MTSFLLRLFIVCFSLFYSFDSVAQLQITPHTSALQLAQKLVGDGVTISNVTFTGNNAMAGHFRNLGQTNINIDSGIVLTTGRAETPATGFNYGVQGDGFDMATDVDASNSWGAPGDANLAAAIGVPTSQMKDACVLEFDFVPLGDTVKFRYVFSSEEYSTSFACNPMWNDAFAFFISGPGITGLQNIALVPNTTLPVSIQNINNVMFDHWPLPPAPNCPMNPTYYVDNTTNTYFTHEGHTVVLTALSRVQPCNTYHLKLVIADNTDDSYDSGVFLEAKSLSSNAVELINNTQTASTGASYLVEGCVTGSFTIRRPLASSSPLTVNLQYAGSAVNGVDVQTMPSSIIIPANETDYVVNIVPIIDNMPEGIEYVKVYSIAGCANASAIPIDSTLFEIRDYDTLGVVPDTIVICRNSAVQLNATAGYATYQWTPATGLNDPNIRTPVATPATEFSTYIATAALGTCHAMDSAFVRWKVMELISTQNVNCNGATNGQIIVSGGNEWGVPVQYAIDNQPYQSGGTFNNLPAGDHVIKINDGTCIDSLVVPVIQLFPDLLISAAPAVTPGNCTGAASGTITVNATGGKPPYEYSSNGTTFQNSNVLMASAGTYTVTVKDANGCTKTYPNLLVPFINSVELATGTDPVICESKSTTLPATVTATSISWTPVTGLSNTTIMNPVASPTVTTMYYITATTGICSKRDSVKVIVNPAPRPDAGADASICFGGTTQLTAGDATEYSWRPSTYLNNNTLQRPDVVRPTAPITYYLKIKDFNGCESLREDTVNVYVTPAVKMFAGNDTIVAMGQPVQLHGVQVGANTVTTFSWSPSYGLNDPTSPNPVATLDKDMTYTLTGRTDINCEGSDIIFVKVYKGPEIYVPTVFTPNGDMRNDILKAWAIGMKEYRYFNVYNRWGALVFSTSDFNRGWDGRIKGVLQNTGTYVWIAEAVDYRGNVIKRKGTTMILQ
jgi:gliding motility-associated-like protein